MDSARSRRICRRFINGTCRFGERCHFRHEFPIIREDQICRYFQKGGCWYGDRCKYLHVLQPEVEAGGSSVPTVSSSSEAYAAPHIRGPEPVLLQAEHLEADIAEEQDVVPTRAAAFELAQSSAAQAFAWEGRNEQDASSSEMRVDGATAAASSTQRSIEETEAFLRSKNMTCGICMDKVYEKTDPRSQMFGLLPNCNHSFCLQCIMTWRKTKDLGPDVIKTCPQCRVRSGFYIPNKYWVEGQAKESLIAAFKEKFSKKSCSYYSRYGCCPFSTDCLYRHDGPPRLGPYTTYTEDDDYESLELLNLILAMTLLDDDDDDYYGEDFGFSFYLSEEYGF